MVAGAEGDIDKRLSAASREIRPHTPALLDIRGSAFQMSYFKCHWICREGKKNKILMLF